MQEMSAYFHELKGTAYEVGKQQAIWLKERPLLKKQYIQSEPLSKEAVKETKQLVRPFSSSVRRRALGIL